MRFVRVQVVGVFPVVPVVSVLIQPVAVFPVLAGSFFLVLVDVVGVGWFRVPVAVFVRFRSVVGEEEVGYGVGLFLGDYFVGDHGR